jgi:catechol 2,3-dioxygenase-like lactoylglutathione lyase family enzyme
VSSSRDRIPSPAAPRLDHVQIAAPPGCEAAAREFYGGLLGLRELEKPISLRDRGGVWFELTGGQVHIGVQESFVPAGKAHPALKLADEGALRALAARLEAAGVDVVWDARIPSVPRFFAADLWGNRLELLSDKGIGRSTRDT